MFTHIFLGTNDVARSRIFYAATMPLLGVTIIETPRPATIYQGGSGALVVAKPADGKPHTVSNGHTLSLAAKTHEAVDAWHAAGLKNGGSDEGAPGIRSGSGSPRYGAYLRDPDGNKLAVFTSD